MIIEKSPALGLILDKENPKSLKPFFSLTPGITIALHAILNKEGLHP